MDLWLSNYSNIRFRRLGGLPLIIFGAGGMLLILAIIRAILTFDIGGSHWVALLDFVFMAAPAGVLMYTGHWMPDSEITRQHYPRIIAWVIGGVAVMFGFIALRDIHPGVTAEWAIGTQAIALTIGSIGGLLIGIQETKAKIRTDQLETNQAELQRQNERLDRFASVVSHDLRNPLTVANGRLDLASEECDSAHLDDVERALGRMESLIDDLLTLAKQGSTVADREPVVLSELVDSAWENVETGEGILNAEIHGTIQADVSRLQQVFENLFRNAVEHGGKDVTVTVGELDDGFYVEDDGPGIPEAERDDVFEAGHTTSEEGTGFGLSIVQQIVEAHGWSIRVTESASGGARFEITGAELTGG